MDNRFAQLQVSLDDVNISIRITRDLIELDRARYDNSFNKVNRNRLNELLNERDAILKELNR